MRNRAVRGRRPAFTLTEMLVVIAIILILATTGILIAPGLAKQQRAANGADQVQGALLIAKQRAKRDQVPTGVRLIYDPANPTNVTELVYVQQPEPYTSPEPYNTVSMRGLLSLSGTTATFSGVNFLAGASSVVDQLVQPGDYLEVNGGGLLFPIVGVANTTLTIGNTQGFMLASPTSNYRIIRQPRQVAGEDSVRLPRDVIIDLALSQNVPQRIVGGTNYEVVFSPAGGVVGKGTVSSDKVLLYVRDNSQATATAGGPSLIAVQIRTGLIGAYPVNVNGTDPYSFTRDPRGSGL
jgi:prepilin-type N-terminal cleavage/methylation domain-containing protein